MENSEVFADDEVAVVQGKHPSLTVNNEECDLQPGMCLGCWS